MWNLNRWFCIKTLKIFFFCGERYIVFKYSNFCRLSGKLNVLNTNLKKTLVTVTLIWSCKNLGNVTNMTYDPVNKEIMTSLDYIAFKTRFKLWISIPLTLVTKHSLSCFTAEVKLSELKLCRVYVMVFSVVWILELTSWSLGRGSDWTLKPVSPDRFVLFQKSL